MTETGNPASPSAHPCEACDCADLRLKYRHPGSPCVCGHVQETHGKPHPLSWAHDAELVQALQERYGRPGS